MEPQQTEDDERTWIIELDEQAPEVQPTRIVLRKRVGPAPRHTWKVDALKSKRKDIYRCDCRGPEHPHYRSHCYRKAACHGDGWRGGLSTGRCSACTKAYLRERKENAAK